VVQGAEFDLLDIRFYAETTPVIWFRSNEPVEDLNNNILTVDDKAILARDTALTAQSDLDDHIGETGVSEHAIATTAVAGFMSAADKLKLDGIQANAQLNILAPVDAIELISRKETTLHSHPLATPTLDGFMTAADKVKLDGIEAGAQVNNITPGQASTLTGGGNADSLHGHGFSVGSESFTAAVHLITDHAGIPGVEAFPGFVQDFNISPKQVLTGVTVFNVPYGFTLETISSGYAEILDLGIWGASESFFVNDVSTSGNTGTTVFECFAGGGGDILMSVWQAGFGT
jgi:hypothetical protein